MAFTVIEWFVVVFAIIGVVKILTIMIKPKAWLKAVKPLYSSGVILFLVELVLAAILFYYLLMEITLVQIVAAILLGAFLTGMTFALYGKETLEWAGKLLKTNVVKRAWLPMIIWVVLMVWVLIEIF